MFFNGLSFSYTYVHIQFIFKKFSFSQGSTVLCNIKSKCPFLEMEKSWKWIKTSNVMEMAWKFWSRNCCFCAWCTCDDDFVLLLMKNITYVLLCVFQCFYRRSVGLNDLMETHSTPLYHLFYLSFSADSWCPDCGRGSETGQAQRTMGHKSRLSGLCGSGHVLVPGCTRQQSSHGVQVPLVPSGSGRPAAGPAGAVGRPCGPVTRSAGPTPPDGHGVRLRSGLPSLQSDGDGVAVVWSLSDTHLHRDLQLGLRPLDCKHRRCMFTRWLRMHNLIFVGLNTYCASVFQIRCTM